MRRNILHFHYEEIVFILMILATDLKDYHEGDLMNFEEAILRLDSLADKDFLKQLKQINTKFGNYVINRLIELKVSCTASMIAIYTRFCLKRIVIQRANGRLFQGNY
jgi:hypothetical protein